MLLIYATVNLVDEACNIAALQRQIATLISKGDQMSFQIQHCLQNIPSSVEAGFFALQNNCTPPPKIWLTLVRKCHEIPQKIGKSRFPDGSAPFLTSLARAEAGGAGGFFQRVPSGHMHSLGLSWPSADWHASSLARSALTHALSRAD
jgi:hypothetical protein